MLLFMFMFIHTSSGGGGHELSGALLDMERAPSNIIWILFDYVFFRIEGTLFILFKMFSKNDVLPMPPGSYVPHV